MEDGGGFEVAIVWRGRRARAFVPTLLADRDLSISPAAIRDAATAVADVLHAAEDLGPDLEALARLLLRSEGVASSSIEGVAAPIVDVVLTEASATGDHTPARWIAANHAAVIDAVRDAHEAPLSVGALCSWHGRLMAGSPTPGRHVGALRDEQGWIGGTSPFDAALVTPPPERVPALVDDLIAYANRDDVDPIVQAAVAHAQFEVIHPFADGNGRVGRLLISWTLTRRLQLVTPPPVSLRLAADVGGYLSGITMFRLGQHEPWVTWFARAASGAGDAQRSLVRSVRELKQDWVSRLRSMPAGRSIRADSSAWRLLDLLPRHLVLTTDAVASELGLTRRSAHNSLLTLAGAGILAAHTSVSPTGKGRRPTRYVSPELLGLVGST